VVTNVPALIIFSLLHRVIRRLPGRLEQEENGRGEPAFELL